MGPLIPLILLRCMLSVMLTTVVVGGLIWLALGREFTNTSLHGFGAEMAAPAVESGSQFVWKYAVGLLAGDAGISTTFQAPVAGLIRERFALSALTLARSFLILLAVTGALAVLSVRSPLVRSAARVGTGVLYSIPVGVLALPLAYVGWPAELSVVAGSLPKAFALFDAVLERTARGTHLVWMRSMGVGWGPVLWNGIIRSARPELLEVMALWVPLLLGTLIVVEVISGQAGLGTLAWRAVQARDLPLLGAITILFAVGSSLAAAAAALCSREARQ